MKNRKFQQHLCTLALGISCLVFVESAHSQTTTYQKLNGTAFGTSGSWGTSGNVYSKALDGNTTSYFDGANGDGNYFGLDLGATNTRVLKKIRFYPRAGYSSRMTGAKIQGSKTSSTSGFVDLYTLSGTPASAWTEVVLNNEVAYQYLRYLAPAGSHGNIAELEFYSATTTTTSTPPAPPASGDAVPSDLLAHPQPVAAPTQTYASTGWLTQYKNQLATGVSPQCPVQAAALVSQDSSWKVVGTGTSASCTEAEFLKQYAAISGTSGKIKFNCGAGYKKIVFTAERTLNKDLVIDGGNLVGFSGGGVTRILSVGSYGTSSGWNPASLTVQNLDFFDGKAPSSATNANRAGGAINRTSVFGTNTATGYMGVVTVIHSRFYNNTGTPADPDLGGGAIFVKGGRLVIANSVFQNNRGGNGGAIGSIGASLTIHNSVFTQNTATGHDGSFAQGGNGGAIYLDETGNNKQMVLCNVKVYGNTGGANASGGGLFINMSNSNGSREAAIIDTEIQNNSGFGQGGGLWYRGAPLTIWNLSILGNQGKSGGGAALFYSIPGGGTTNGLIGNATVSDNTAAGGLGGGLWISNATDLPIWNSTIAGNKTTGSGTFAGGVAMMDGAKPTFKNSVVTDNQSPDSGKLNCNSTANSIGSNLQYPSDLACMASRTVAAASLAAAANNGGFVMTRAIPTTSAASRKGTACPKEDARRKPRASTASCDLGAFEIQ